MFCQTNPSNDPSVMRGTLIQMIFIHTQATGYLFENTNGYLPDVIRKKEKYI